MTAHAQPDVNPELFNGYEGGVSYCAIDTSSVPLFSLSSSASSASSVSDRILLGSKLLLIRIHVHNLNISLSLLMER